MPSALASLGVGAGIASAPPFDPLSLSPVIALRPEGLASFADGDPIGTWTNEGSLTNVTQATGSKKPLCKTAIVNGWRVARFDAVDDCLDGMPDLFSLTAGTVFLVVKITADPPASAAKTGIWKMGNDGADNHYPYTDGNVYDGCGTSIRKATGNPTPALTSFRDYCVVSANGAWTSYFDGTQHFTTATNTVGFPHAPILGNSGSVFLDGDIAEFLVYGSALNTTDRQSVEGYLRTKFALS